MKENLFDILSKSNQSLKESAKNYNMQNLMNDVRIQETKTHLYITNFPGAFGDTQNKNNRIYDQESLVYAVNQFNGVKDENPYFCYMFDGHKDDDSYEFIIGKVESLHLREDIKCVMIDMKINKGAKSQQTIKNIIQDGDPLGASMRILSPNSINVSKDDLMEINPNITFLEDDNNKIAQLMSKDNDIEYITGESYIQRFDITQFPSFNDAFVAKPFIFQPEFNSESIKLNNNIKLKDINQYKESALLFSTTDGCVTNACTFRHTMKDFVDLLNMDESITSIKDNPDLYNDMLKFSYLNLSPFEFDKIIDSDYLSENLAENNITKKDIKQQKKTIIEIAGKNNIISYLLNNNEYNTIELSVVLNNTLNALVDENDIFYQIITTNFLHYIILSTIVLSGKTGIKINNTNKMKDKLAATVKSESVNNQIIIDLIKELDKSDIKIYDYINLIFNYIYQYIDVYAKHVAPLTIINESMKIFLPKKHKGVVTVKFIK